jgi:plastocyanin
MFSTRPSRLIIPAIALAGLLFAACGGGDSDNGGGGNGNGDTPVPVDTVTEITVEMHDNFFEPESFAVKVGETVTITAPNVGAAVHNMVILGADGQTRLFSSDITVRPGDESVFEATFDAAGTYVFQCDYHLPEMVGTVVVVN